MDFSEALRSLKKGETVSRLGWNKPHQITLQTPDENSKMTKPYIFMEIYSDENGVEWAKVPWVASQTDLLAEDWHGQSAEK